VDEEANVWASSERAMSGQSEDVGQVGAEKA